MPDVLSLPVDPSTLMLVLAKITLLLGLAVLGARLLRRATAGIRHFWWLVVLVATLLIPVLEFTQPMRIAVIPAGVVPGARATYSPAVEVASTEASPASPATIASPTTPALTSESPGTSSTPPSITTRLQTSLMLLRSLPPLTLIAMAWLVGMLISAAWLLRSWLAASRIVRRASVVSTSDWLDPLYEVADRIGLDDVPRVVRSADVRMPFACGVRTPTIVLPLSSDAWSLERRQAVLLHELAHVRRNDLLGHTFARLVCAVYWFHPMVWMAAGALRAESEQACDDLAVSSGTRPSDYAEHLLDIVTSVKGDATPAVAIAMARRSEFEGRMLAILDPERPRRNTTRRQAVTLAGLIGAVTLLVGAAAPVTSSAPSATMTSMAGLVQRADSTNVGRDAVTPDAVVHDAPAYNVPAYDAPAYDAAAHDAVVRNAVTDSGREAEKTTSETRYLSVRPPAAPAVPPSGQLGRRVDQALSRVVTQFSTDVSTGILNALGPAVGRQSMNSGLAGFDSLPMAERARLLVRILTTDSSASIRRVAAWGLNEYLVVDPGVRTALITALRRDTDAKVREVAAWALADDPASRTTTSALIDALRDVDSRVRGTAAWAIGTLEAREAEPALLKALEDPEASVRSRAAWALGNVTPAQLPAGLTTHLEDSGRDVRRAVTWALYQIGDDRAVPALLRAFRAEKDPMVRRDMFRTLVSLGEQSTEFIKQMLDNNDPDIREQAISLLAGRPQPTPWPWPWPDPRPTPQR